MADPTMAPAADASGAAGDPSMDAAAPSDYTICIKVKGDGSFAVGVKDDAPADDGTGAAPDASGAAAAPAAGDDAGDDADYSPVKSIKDALSVALDIYKAGGQMQSTGDDDFNSGFGQNQPKATS